MGQRRGERIQNARRACVHKNLVFFRRLLRRTTRRSHAPRGEGLLMTKYSVFALVSLLAFGMTTACSSGDDDTDNTAGTMAGPSPGGGSGAPAGSGSHAGRPSPARN